MIKALFNEINALAMNIDNDIVYKVHPVFPTIAPKPGPKDHAPQSLVMYPRWHDIQPSPLIAVVMSEPGTSQVAQVSVSEAYTQVAGSLPGPVQ